MKTVSHFPPVDPDRTGGTWHYLIGALEQKLMQKNRGKSNFSRRLRCQSKLVLMSMLEKME
jgi:hypothetical protein